VRLHVLADAAAGLELAEQHGGQRSDPTTQVPYAHGADASEELSADVGA